MVEQVCSCGVQNVEPDSLLPMRGDVQHAEVLLGAKHGVECPVVRDDTHWASRVPAHRGHHNAAGKARPSRNAQSVPAHRRGVEPQNTRLDHTHRALCLVQRDALIPVPARDLDPNCILGRWQYSWIAPRDSQWRRATQGALRISRAAELDRTVAPQAIHGPVLSLVLPGSAGYTRRAPLHGEVGARKTPAASGPACAGRERPR